MKKSTYLCFLASLAVLLMFLVWPSAVLLAQTEAEEDGPPLSTFIQDFDFSGVMFLAFEHSELHQENRYENEFTIKRAYITFRQELSPKIDVRFTQDVSIDESGDGEGDIELRLKYAYANYRTPDFGILQASSLRFGVVDRPWIDFEQDINDYRAQKSMFLDQNDFLSSADYGLTFKTSLGPALDAPLSSNPGRYGSLALGFYNGGGYSALEQNTNKLIEARLSLRPLPDRLPGLQGSFLGALGSGNIPESPDFELAGTALSYEAARLDIFLQAFRSTGDGDGRYLKPGSAEAARLQGWSAFAEWKPLSQYPIAFTVRADEVVDRDIDKKVVTERVAGMGYIFENGSKIVFDISTREENRFDMQSDFTRYELLAEIRF